MKKFILGFLTAILFLGLANIINLNALDRDDEKTSRIMQTIIDLYELNYIAFPLTGRCDDEPKRMFGDGTILTEAQYFACDSFQVMINVKRAAQ